jgi:hypothetical protein
MAVAFFILTGVFLFSQAEYSSEEALKVIRLIDKIQEEQIGKREGFLKNVIVTESEFNSYIAFRIEAEQEEIMKELRLKFFNNNKVEGKIVIDLKSQNLPKFLHPQMTFYLGGKIEVEEGLVRVNLKDLFLENQRINPEILDLVIYIGSKIQNTEPFSIEDWMELPYGIKNIKIQEKEAVFYY